MNVANGAPAMTEDRLLGGRIPFCQPVEGYRVAVDPILLAAAVPVDGADMVLDLGSGTGAAALCLHQRRRDCAIVGLESDTEMLDLARHNARLNGAGDRITFLHGDVAAPPAEIAAHSFDHVMSNPPYLEPGRADRRVAAASRRTVAAIEGSADLATWIAAMATALKPQGRLTLIHRADRLDAVLAELHRHAGEIVVYPLWPKAGRPAKRVLVSARKAVATPLRLAPGMVLHEASGAFTEAARAVLENGAPLVI